MLLCPKCSFVLDVTKVTGKGAEKKTISNVNSFIDTVLDPETDLFKLRVTFKEGRVKSSPKYKKLEGPDKKKVMVAFTRVTSELKGDGIYFQCSNCGYMTPVRRNTTFYKENYNTSEKIKLLENYELECLDQTLPRTKDYVCRNKACPTLDKKNLLAKEAVFFRKRKSYELTYACCVCKKGWLV